MNTQENETSPENTAWHQQPAMWIVLGVLAFTVVSSIVLLVVAVTNAPEVIERTAAPVETSAERLDREIGS